MTRRSKHDLEREVADLQAKRGGREYPLAGIITTMSSSGELKWIDRAERLMLIDGQEYRVTENAIEVLLRGESCRW